MASSSSRHQPTKLASESRQQVKDQVIYRALTADDLESVLILNQSEVPHVGPLDMAKLVALVERSYKSIGAFVVGEQAEAQLAGFIITFKPQADYESQNYQWFEQKYNKHLYIDRLAVDGQYRQLGIGRGLYAAAEEHLGDLERLTCEVNLEPANPVSLGFHERIGFTMVGEQVYEDHYVKRVAMLAKTCQGD